MRRLALLVLLCVFASAPSAWAQDVTTLRVSQAYVDLPEITVFFGARGTDGTFVSPIDSQQVSVSAGETDLTVDTVTAFSGSGRGVAYVFLADVSKSIQPQQYERLRQALGTWIGSLSGEDQAALLTFGSTVDVVQDFTSNIERLQTRVDSLRPRDQNTRLHAGLVQALELGRRRDPDLPERRVIVVLSDGKDDVTGGMTAEEVRERMRVDRTPIYAIGYARPPMTDGKEAALDKLGTFARTSGGQFIEAGAQSIPETFEDLRQRAEEVHIAELHCTACDADGTVRPLRVQLTSGANTMTDGLRVRMQSTGSSEGDGDSSSKETDPNLTRNDSYMQAVAAFFAELPWWGYGIGALVLVALAVGIYFYVRREDEEPEPAPQPTPKMKTKSPEPKGIPLHFETVGQQESGSHEARIADRILVGRSRDCDVVITDDQEASRQNSEIVREDGELYIRDLDSQNGTLVNGVPISGSYQLKDGDRILIGRTELRIEVPDELQPVR